MGKIFWLKTGANSLWITYTGNWWTSPSDGANFPADKVQAGAAPQTNDEVYITGTSAPGAAPTSMLLGFDTSLFQMTFSRTITSLITIVANGYLLIDSTSSDIFGAEHYWDGYAAASGISIIFRGNNAINTGTLGNNALFYGESISTGTVGDDAVFNDGSSTQSGSVGDNAIFNDISFAGSVVGINATFNNNSNNQATVGASCVFNHGSHNFGVIGDANTGTCYFYDYALDYGVIFGNVVYAPTTFPPVNKVLNDGTSWQEGNTLKTGTAKRNWSG